MNHQLNFEVNVEAKLTDNRLMLITSVNDFVTRKIVDLEEATTRDALIKLGWTPPPAVKQEEKDQPKNSWDRWTCLYCLSSIKGVHTKVCPNYEGKTW